ncbi:MAG TPA: hypothetical protein VHE81_20995 [Lacipirellulaceae bacterium]|nr:hypothetical protein [Lacipirellulaceae bacterium]
MLGRVAGISAQNMLWSYLANGLVKLHLPGNDEWTHISNLMNQYADLPLDMADASLVSAAEALGDFRLFSIDASMRAVRIAGRNFFDVVP